MSLTHPTPTQAQHPWRWRDRTGQMRDPKRMTTNHLFFTIRMIWNHTMPVSARLRPYISYDFSPFYTKAYMLEAIKHLTPELATRTDMKPEWKRELSRMLDWLATHQLPGAEPNLQLEKP